MYLYQFSGVINHNVQYFDDFDFINSLPLTIPIVLIHIIAAYKLRTKTDKLDIHEMAMEEYNSVLTKELE